MKLHIGGTERQEGWLILDIDPRPEVDIVGDARSLAQFGDSSIETLYASHVLEHFHHRWQGEVLAVLREWYRVLQPGGELWLSVPNLAVLAWLLLHPDLPPDGHWVILSMIYGGQDNAYDIHRVGFTQHILSCYLADAGFAELRRQETFGLFADTSSLKILNQYISLNVIASK
ncbi:MAG: methyltransferase domain-containing protein [Oscillatoriales cyanobacterium SM2_1_8]|nr:methyltransferase domain-containing protein [Oscillatoriales cyanobacterium SM2_1_8]